jgi:hypothetical protein
MKEKKVIQKIERPALAQAYENNPNFLKWFGDSEVVDSDGKPLVVYHGTNMDITQFDRSKVGSNYGFDREGFFFCANKESASLYAAQDPYEMGGTRSGANVVPVYLRVGNLLQIDQIKPEDFGLDTVFDEGTLFDNNREKIIQLAKIGWYDGMQIGEDYIAFYPDQIKSAIGNCGDFDPENPDITK